MSLKVSVTCYGALGDTILQYYRENSAFGYIKPFKKKYPNSLIKVVCCSSNAQTSELFRENPYIDKIVHVPWTFTQQKERNDIIRKALHGYKALLSHEFSSNIVYQAPRIYLNKEDKIFTRHIMKQGKYILVHPFASCPGKQDLGIEYYPALIDVLIDELGYNVVTVGATYDRVFQEGTTHKTEEFIYERDGLFNLVNKTNVRVAVELARNAYGYMGAWSAFYCASWFCPAKPIVFCIPNRAPTIDLINGKRFYGSEYKKIIVPQIDISDLSQEEIVNLLQTRQDGIQKEVIAHLGKNK